VSTDQTSMGQTGTDQTAPERNGVTLAYRTAGSPDGVPLLLVHGLATQLVLWHEELVAALVKRGFYVVTFDNRDIGRSTHLHDAPTPDVMAAIFSGDTSSASYDLSDMAADAVGLLDHLGIEQTHVLGVSMGGMIAQTIAVDHPARVLTLTSVMSTPSPKIGSPTQAASAVLLAAPATSREEAVSRALETYRVIGSPGFPLDEAWLSDVAGQSYDRGYDPTGVARQLLAIHASGDRTEALRALSLPTLVFHGEDDPLVQLPGGHATAEAIPGARLVVVPGMGHNLPSEIWPQLLDEVSALVAQSAR
jgi:pimeloyl-ACP methyl ester carboxylesterase